MALRRKSEASGVYQIKVTLKYSHPPIWRRIQVTGDTTLHQLHHVLQVVMGWDNFHLHQFIIGKTEYGEPGPEEDLIPMEDDSSVTLSEIAPRERTKFLYEYDFGDCWRHELVIEKILPREEGTRYPVCLAGKGACPPEDCGGIYGYYELVEAVRDPKHKRHEELLDWLGDSFDPEEFDIDAINRVL